MWKKRNKIVMDIIDILIKVGIFVSIVVFGIAVWYLKKEKQKGEDVKVKKEDGMGEGDKGEGEFLIQNEGIAARWYFKWIPDRVRDDKGTHWVGVGVRLAGARG